MGSSCFALLVVAFLLSAVSPGRAQDEAAGSTAVPDHSAVEKLVETLEDPAARDALRTFLAEAPEVTLVGDEGPFAGYWRSYWNILIVLVSGIEDKEPLSLLGRMEVTLFLLAGLVIVVVLPLWVGAMVVALLYGVVFEFMLSFVPALVNTLKAPSP